MKRTGIVVIHGIGRQKESDALLEMGQPLLEWVLRWAEERQRNYVQGLAAGQRQAYWDGCDRHPPAYLQKSGLAFATEDDGFVAHKYPPHLTLHFDDDPALGSGFEWLVTETWWAQSYRSPALGVVSAWVLKHWVTLVGDFVRFLTDRIRWLVVPFRDDDPYRQVPPLPARFIDALNMLVLLAVSLLAMVPAVLITPVLVLLTQVPWKPVRDFALTVSLRNFLTANVAEMRALVEDPIQEANVRARLEETVAWLVGEGCNKICIVAHSAGVLAAFDVLAHPESWNNPLLARRIRKLMSVGPGLNKAWLLDRNQARLHGCVEDVYWADFWSTYDPVPLGRLTPPELTALPGAPLSFPRRVWNWLTCRGARLPIFAPKPAIRARLESQGWQDLGRPVNLRVTNSMDLVTDHGGYWENEEEVISRIAQEIDSEDYAQSRFAWPAAGAARQQQLWVGRRVWRVTCLVAARLWMYVLLSASLATQAPFLGSVGHGLWNGISGLPGVAGLAVTFGTLHDGIRAALPPVWIPVMKGWLAAHVASGPILRDVPFLILGAAPIAFAFWVLYQVGATLAWDGWDVRARKAFLGDLASRLPAGARRPPRVLFALSQLLWLGTATGLAWWRFGLEVLAYAGWALLAIVGLFGIFAALRLLNALWRWWLPAKTRKAVGQRAVLAGLGLTVHDAQWAADAGGQLTATLEIELGNMGRKTLPIALDHFKLSDSAGHLYDADGGTLAGFPTRFLGESARGTVTFKLPQPVGALTCRYWPRELLGAYGRIEIGPLP